jgi:uncharacterized protein YozE (UPF0346 family)
MRFAKWLLQQDHEDTAIGDLARDARQDKSFPKSTGYVGVQQYLESAHACKDAMAALEVAKLEYDKLYPNPNINTYRAKVHIDNGRWILDTPMRR